MRIHNKRSVLVTVTNQHWIHKTVVHTLMKLMQDGRYTLRFEMPSHKPYENNLHHIVKDFIAGDYDFWLNIDSDNPPRQNPLDLVELDKDIIGLPTPIWHYKGNNKERPIYWNAYKYNKKADAYNEFVKREGLQRVDAIGTGCFLAARRVFENKRLQQGAFIRKLNKDGTVDKGNDLSFCERAREQGFKIYAHFGYPCDHYKEHELNDIVGAFRNLYE